MTSRSERPRRSRGDHIPAISAHPAAGRCPSTLQLSIAEGSTIEVSLEGSCASVDGGSAEYRAAAVRGGTINLGIAVDLEIPIVGTQTFDIATLAIPLPEASYDVVAKKSAVTLGEAPEGSAAAPRCASPDGSGGGGAGGADGWHTGGGTTSGTTSGEPGCVDDTGCAAEEGCNSKGVCKPLTYLCINETIQIGDLELLQGDREFGGNGPDVLMTVTPGVSAGGVVLDVVLRMTEVGSDGSTGERAKQFTFPGAVDSVHDLGGALQYTDTDTELEIAAGPDSFPEARCMGDTAGEDICAGPSCSHCELDIACILVTKP